MKTRKLKMLIGATFMVGPSAYATEQGSPELPCAKFAFEQAKSKFSEHAPEVTAKSGALETMAAYSSSDASSERYIVRMVVSRGRNQALLVYDQEVVVGVQPKCEIVSQTFLNPSGNY